MQVRERIIQSKKSMFEFRPLMLFLWKPISKILDHLDLSLLIDTVLKRENEMKIGFFSKRPIFAKNGPNSSKTFSTCFSVFYKNIIIKFEKTFFGNFGLYPKMGQSIVVGIFVFRPKSWIFLFFLVLGTLNYHKSKRKWFKIIF